MKTPLSITRNLAIAAFCLISSAALADPLTVLTTAGKTINLDVEIADTRSERKPGLMNRDVLADGTGMLFIFEEPETPKFWMKDTRIALDMIFIGEDGVIKGIHENAIPHDLTPIPAPEPVLAVLEIGGKKAKTLGISTGDKVIHKIFEKDLK